MTQALLPDQRLFPLLSPDYQFQATHLANSAATIFAMFSESCRKAEGFQGLTNPFLIRDRVRSVPRACIVARVASSTKQYI